MAERVLRWGLLSTARINRALIPPLRASLRNELVAVASRDLKRAEGYAREWDIPRAFGSYDELLADPGIDVIYNPLPNALHAEWTIKAAQAGKHVLCEKPLATTLSEVDAMAEAARQHGVVVAEAFMYRHHAQTLTVKEIVRGGVLGELQLIRGAFTFFLDRPGDVRLDPALGGGSLWDVGCYPVSYARFLTGEDPLDVFGWGYQGPSGVDLSFTGQMRFPGGYFAQFDCGFRTSFRSQIEVVGSDANLLIPQPFKPELENVVFLSRGGEAESISIPGDDLYLGEVEDLADAVLSGRSPRISLEDSRQNVAALLALYESARLGRPVRL